jgi:alkylation response protein AidB-like acyl-CoA dehydrogenase
MQLMLDSTQTDLQQLVRSYLDDKWSTSALMDSMLGRANAATVTWSELARDLDLVGLAIPEAYGGSDCSVVELSVVMAELGRSLYLGPFFVTAGLAVTCLIESQDAGAMRAYLPAIGRGELVVTLVGLHEIMTGDHAALPTATEGRSSWAIEGSSPFVLDCEGTDLLIVFANTATGVEAMLVDSDAPGMSRVTEHSLDLTQTLGSVRFEGTPADLLGAPGSGVCTMGKLRMAAAVLKASQDIGTAEKCLELAVAHAKERVQFGRPIGSFQAIKHRCADMLLAIEAAKAAGTYAVRAVATDAPDALVSALNATAASSDALYLAATSAGQVFGGVGYTWEHPMHLYLRRAIASQFLFGTPVSQREELLQLHIDAL